MLAQVGMGCEEHTLDSALQYWFAAQKAGVVTVPPHAHAAALVILPSSFSQAQQVPASVSTVQGLPAHMT